jgi:hypothetical protein
MCVTSLGRPYKKNVTSDVSIRHRFKENVSQRGLVSHRPHGTTTALNQLTCHYKRVTCTAASVYLAVVAEIVI